jgi:large subunit ribosomal protein L37e
MVSGTYLHTGDGAAWCINVPSVPVPVGDKTVIRGEDVSADTMTGTGTPSKGKRQKKTHVKCRRCGEKSYHKTKKRCSNCGFGKSSKQRSYSWENKSGDN